jgi:hypothetical protein
MQAPRQCLQIAFAALAAVVVALLTAPTPAAADPDGFFVHRGTRERYVRPRGCYPYRGEFHCNRYCWWEAGYRYCHRRPDAGMPHHFLHRHRPDSRVFRIH